VRLTVEQDILFPWIPNDKVEELTKEPIFQKYKIDAGNLTRGLVSCTGAQVRAPSHLHGNLWLSAHAGHTCNALFHVCINGLECSICTAVAGSPTEGRARMCAQFCGLAVIETKNRAMAIVEKLEQQLDFPKKVRIHWTGCPNSCGQVSCFSPRLLSHCMP
jgi:ferredoxin-nitrite reductase